MTTESIDASPSRLDRAREKKDAGTDKQTTAIPLSRTRLLPLTTRSVNSSCGRLSHKNVQSTMTASSSSVPQERPVVDELLVRVQKKEGEDLPDPASPGEWVLYGPTAGQMRQEWAQREDAEQVDWETGGRFWTRALLRERTVVEEIERIEKVAMLQAEDRAEVVVTTGAGQMTVRERKDTKRPKKVMSQSELTLQAEQARRVRRNKYDMSVFYSCLVAMALKHGHAGRGRKELEAAAEKAIRAAFAVRHQDPLDSGAGGVRRRFNAGWKSRPVDVHQLLMRERGTSAMLDGRAVTRLRLDDENDDDNREGGQKKEEGMMTATTLTDQEGHLNLSEAVSRNRWRFLQEGRPSRARRCLCCAAKRVRRCELELDGRARMAKCSRCVRDGEGWCVQQVRSGDEAAAAAVEGIWTGSLAQEEEMRAATKDRVMRVARATTTSSLDSRRMWSAKAAVDRGHEKVRTVVLVRDVVGELPFFVFVREEGLSQVSLEAVARKKLGLAVQDTKHVGAGLSALPGDTARWGFPQWKDDDWAPDARVEEHPSASSHVPGAPIVVNSPEDYFNVKAFQKAALRKGKVAAARGGIFFKEKANFESKLQLLLRQEKQQRGSALGHDGDDAPFDESQFAATYAGGDVTIGSPFHPGYRPAYKGFAKFGRVSRKDPTIGLLVP